MNKLIQFLLIGFITITVSCGGGSSSKENKDNENVSPYSVDAKAGYGCIELSWDSFGDTNDDFIIMRMENDGALEEIKTSYNYYSYTDQDVEPNKTYKYKIIQESSNTETRLSEAISVLPIGAPSDLTVENDEFSGLKISFTLIPANDELSINYSIERSEDNNTFTSIETIPVDYYLYTEGYKLSKTDSALNPDKTYYYRVICSHRDNSEYSSSSVSKEGRLSRPSTPDNFAVTNTAGMKLTWNKIENVAGYKVYRSTDNIAYENIKTVTPATTLTYTDTTCGPDIDYYYKITSYSGTNESERSSEKTAKIAVADFSPDAPNASSGSTTFTLSWKEVPGVDSYRFYYCETEVGSYTQYTGDFTGTSTTSINPPQLEKYYYWKMSIIKNGSESNRSNLVIGKKVKYGSDIYEDDDYEFESNIIDLSGGSTTRIHTLDSNDSSIYGDNFIVYNKSGSSKKIRVTFTEIDLNGNTGIRVTSTGSRDITVNNEYVETASTISNNTGWKFYISRKSFENNTAKYTITVELVNP